MGDYARACEAVADHLDELHRAWARAWRLVLRHELKSPGSPQC